MTANNETGVIQPVAAVAEIARLCLRPLIKNISISKISASIPKLFIAVFMTFAEVCNNQK